jgi:hypothetical protein
MSYGNNYSARNLTVVEEQEDEESEDLLINVLAKEKEMNKSGGIEHIVVE